MNIEDDDDAIKPDNTHCVEAKSINETPDLRRIEFPTKGSSTLPQAEINEPGQSQLRMKHRLPRRLRLLLRKLSPLRR
jgi:hypothetical protein